MVITTATHFIEAFHGIQGDRVKLRKQNLYSILKTSQLPYEEKQLLAQHLNPKNYLEIVFHADVLIYFKITSALLELLKKGHEVYVSKIIKQRWLFEELFKNVSPNQLVDEVLPSLSYSVKVKVLKKLLPVLSEEQVDEVFDHLLNKYGLYFATRVLTGCSAEKIKDTLKIHDVKLSTGDLKSLSEKDFSLIETYFEEKKLRKYDEICTEKFCKYLADNNPVSFWKILKIYQPNVKLGRRITKKVFKHIEKQEIVNDPKTYTNYFKNESVVRILNHEGHLPEFYKNLYPDEISNIQNENILNTILKCCPKQKRYKLFQSTFEQVYDEDMLNNVKFIDTDLMELMKNKEFRVKWAHLKFAETGSPEYLGYYDTQEAIPLIKERIDLTSQLTVRNKLLMSLIKCCAVNEDMNALEKVLQYFCDRHRNTVYQTRERFLEHFRNNFESKVNEFTDAIWKCFMEIVTIQRIHEEYDITYNKKLIGKYIAKLYETNNESQAENIMLKCFPKSNTYFMVMPDYNHYETNIDIKKKIVVTAYKLFKKSQIAADDEYKNEHIRFFITLLLEFNKEHPEEKIVFDEDMQNDIRSLFQNEHNHYYLKILIMPTLSKNNLDDFEQELLTLVWEHLFRDSADHLTIKFLKWFCAYQPTTLIQHIDKIGKMFLQHSMYLRDMFWFKSFSHLGFDELIKKICVSEVSDEKMGFPSSNSVFWLSHLQSTEEYIKLGEDYNLFPTNLKLDTEDEKAATKFKLQKSYIEMIKNTENPSKYLPLILEKYCQGDFLQASLSPVYKAFSKIPEESLMSYFKNILERKNISFSKHAVVLACNVFDKNVVLQALKQSEGSENKSFKKSVFRSVLKYFSKSPTRELFNILLMWLQFLTEQDLESLKGLFSVKIDKNYRDEYLQHTWRLIKTFKDSSEIHEIRHSCLKSLNEADFEKLTDDFCKEIIQMYFLSEPDLDEIYLFVINFLLFNKKKENFEYVFQNVSDFKLKHWSDIKPSNTKKINKFVKTFVSVTNEREVELDVLEKFSKNWETTFLPYEAFEEYLLLNFAVLWKRSSHNLESFVLQIMQYLENVLVEYNDTLTIFANVLSQFSDFMDEKIKLNLLLSIAKSSNVKLAGILVIEIIRIKHDFISEDRIRKKYSKIDAALKEAFDNNSIKLKYNLLLSEF